MQQKGGCGNGWSSLDKMLGFASNRIVAFEKKTTLFLVLLLE
jgi:hypothetical protein